MVSLEKALIKSLTLGCVLYCISVEALHLVNLTGLSNCGGDGLKPSVYLTEVWPEFNPDNELCVAMHGTYHWTKVMTGPRLLQMVFYRCPKDSEVPCEENPIYHEEILDCNRFMDDSSGPWHMYSSAMETGSKCGESLGEFALDFSSLKIDHLVNYLHIDDEEYSRFRIRTKFLDAESKEMVACANIDFDLLKAIT